MSVFFNYLILPLINARLHAHLRDKVMGDGSETEILNYRTGRFARSAYALNLTQTRGDLVTIFYTYMKNPYAVFEYPGSHLAKPRRDPRYLIGRSIRQIATEITGGRFGFITELQ